jgi:6-phosphogluconolactonase
MTKTREGLISNYLRATVMLVAAILVLQNAAILAQDDNKKTDAESARFRAGAVFALTNAASSNEVAMYNRAFDGTLNRVGSFPTMGNGTGSPLDSQGALILNEDNTRLYACNPGSDTITVFAVLSYGLHPIQVINSGGDLPLSLTIHEKLLYALNSGTGSNISGFTVNSDGTLSPLAGSFRRLSTFIGSPAQIQFNPAGNVLVITHKATDLLVAPQNIIDTFTVGAFGLPSAMPQANPSNGIRPFGFAFRSDGVMIVSESFNVRMGQSATSSYLVNANGTIQVISGSVGNGQTDACWIVITNDGRFAYETNFISGTISSYSVAVNGSLSLLNAAAASTGEMSQPEDMDLSGDGRYLYALLTGTGRVAAYQIEKNGSLTSLGQFSNIPPMAGATGLAAF